jgi:hypothetical protein
VNHLVKRLRREVLANPKKGALLGLMVLVGVYFWAPLVAGWLGGKPSRPAPAGAATTAPAMPGLTQSTSPKAGEKPAVEQPWYMLGEWMDRDPRRQPVGPQGGQRDPFCRVKEKEVVKKDPEKREPEKKPVTVASLAIKLGGTVLGGGRKVALLNGKTYREGDDVKLTRDGQTIVLKLVEIHAQSVVLIRDDRRLELKMPPSPLAGAIEVVKKE